MPNSNYNVQVSAEVVPHSDTYYRLPAAQKAQADALFLNDLNNQITIPPHNLFFSNSSLDDILPQVNNWLLPRVPAPPGHVLVLPSEQLMIGWKPTSLGHMIGFMARIRNTSTGVVTSWELNPVSVGGMTQHARVGFGYLCQPA